MYADAAAGMGGTAMAKRLNAAGIPGPRGGPWYADRVNSILVSGFGAGLIVTGKRKNATWVPGAHQAVISEATWQAFLDQRAARATGRGQDTRGRYELSGLMRCGACGAKMSSAPVRGVTGRAFICSAYRHGKHPTYCSVSRRRAEAVVMKWMRDYAAEIEEAAAAAPKAPRADGRARARRRREEAERALAKLTAGWASGTVPDDAYAPARDLLNERLTAAREAERVAEAAVTSTPAPLPEGLLEDWPTLAVEARRAILGQYIRAVEVTPVPGHRPAIEVIPSASH
jgi:hypothetical protein